MKQPTFKQIFKKDKNIVIGALHFPPLLGFPDFPGFNKTLKMAIADLKAFEEGGVDAVFLENNYGLSNEKIETSHAIAMGRLIGELRSKTKLPLGASVLWNDYEAALSLAVTYNLQFIRIPVFVDTVEPYCGVIKGDPKKVARAQKALGAGNVALFTDILVKHSKHITTHSLEVAAKKAIEAGSDALIVTGDWTGQSPDEKTLETLRSKIGDFPILVGSGANAENGKALCGHANGVIISTSLKTGSVKKGEQNVKGFEQRISKAKVQKFIQSL